MTSISRTAAKTATAVGIVVGLFVSGHAMGQQPFQTLDVRRVKVGGEIGRRIDVTLHNNLLVLKADEDFLKPFQTKRRKGGYIGLGKLIDSLVRLAAHTGDQKAVARKNHVVADTIATQEPDGYIGIMAKSSRMWPLWDVHEMGYLIYGLTSDYAFFGEKKSLEAARRLADYVIEQWSAKPDAVPGGGEITLHMAVTGLDTALLALSEQTGDAKYRDFLVKARTIHEWNYPIVRGRWGDIGGHVYTYLCRCIAQLRLREYRPNDANLLRPTRRAWEFMTKGNGMVVTGTCGDHECWHDTQAGTMNLGETCATAYLIRWLDQRMRMAPDAKYGDVMERAIFNALFAAQSPDGRWIRYYSPFEGKRSYFKGDTYCCPCNYRRIIAELPAMIYYRTTDGLAVNLYTPSQASLELADGTVVKLRQKTDYPNSGRVVLRVDPAKTKRFEVRLRIPAWCDRATVAVNDKPVEGNPKGGSFFALRRVWKAGDALTLDMPMKPRLVRGRRAQAGRVAVLRGPVVFCLNPDRNEKTKKIDLQIITIDPTTLTGPIKDETVRPNGMAITIEAWPPGSWYPMAKKSLKLTLTEFPDPGGRATTFHVPNPNAESFVDDELLSP